MCESSYLTLREGGFENQVLRKIFIPKKWNNANRTLRDEEFQNLYSCKFYQLEKAGEGMQEPE
jgi:hypothetical protein